MAKRDDMLFKILKSTVCQDEKRAERKTVNCYDIQSRFKDDLLPTKIQNCGSNAQTFPHPPVQRLYGNPLYKRPIRNRFAQEMFLKYPLMMPKIEREIIGRYGGNDPVGITTYRGEFRNPKDVIEELEARDLVRTGASDWSPSHQGTVGCTHRMRRAGNKICLTRDEYGARNKAKEKLSEELAYKKKILSKRVYPKTTEYRDNINKIAQFIIDKKIHTEEMVLVSKQPTLPDD